jgi:enoyl-CoA hydratase
MPAGVRTEREGSVLHLVLDAPEHRNALSRPMLRALADTLEALDEQVAAVVLSGHGGTFSAGADFRELSGTPDDEGYDDEVARVTAAIAAVPRPVVAALEGPCMGAAADLALSCDVRVAAQGSFVQVPAVRLGILYNPDAVARLGGRLPHDTVRRLLLLGERFPAEEARRAGLVSVVVPRGEAVKQALDLLDELTVEQVDALAATKALLNDLDTRTYDATHWASRRRALLGSPARAAALGRARRKHTDKET